MKKQIAISGLSAALILAGCAKQAPQFPADPLDQAAVCGVITAASERAALGAKGDLPADAQLRILHYAMLYASSGEAVAADKVNAVSRRMSAVADETVKGEWQQLQPKCASAFPAAQITQPVLPAKPFDAMLQCNALAAFVRKVLTDQGPTYGAAANSYGLFIDRLDPELTRALRAAGLRNGKALEQKKQEELAAAVKLGQPPAVLQACQKAYAA